MAPYIYLACLARLCRWCSKWATLQQSQDALEGDCQCLQPFHFVAYFIALRCPTLPRQLANKQTDRGTEKRCGGYSETDKQTNKQTNMETVVCARLGRVLVAVLVSFFFLFFFFWFLVLSELVFITNAATKETRRRRRSRRREEEQEEEAALHFSAQ